MKPIGSCDLPRLERLVGRRRKRTSQQAVFHLFGWRIESYAELLQVSARVPKRTTAFSNVQCSGELDYANVKVFNWIANDSINTSQLVLVKTSICGKTPP